MSLLRGSRQQPQQVQLPQYTGIQLPSSSSALAIPISYGLNKLGINIIYYNNFVAVPILQAQQSGGKGGSGGGGLQIVGYYYLADLQMALCEGPITGIGQVFVGQKQYIYSPSSPNPLGLTLPNFQTSGYVSTPSLALGTSVQMPWSVLGAFGQTLSAPALAYRGISVLSSAPYNLGQGASVGSIQFEIAGLLYGTGANAIDADPALVIQDFLTNDKHGAEFPTSELDTSSLLGASGDSSVQTYCRALGLCFSPQLVSPEAGNSVLSRWLQLLNLGAYYSAGRLRIVPFGDLSITGTDGTVWNTPTTPVADLDDTAYLFKDGEDPVTVDIVDPINLPTVQVVEAVNRSGVNVQSALIVSQISDAIALMQQLSGQSGGGSLPQPQGLPQYNPTPVYARDLSMAQRFGVRVGQTVSAHEICDLNVASIIAQIILQRVLYIRKKYYFSLDWRYCLLEPMDIVTLTDSYLGLNKKKVRILRITEGDDWCSDYEAEDFVPGVSTPGPNVTAGTSHQGNNAAQVADPVDAVLIYEPPILLTGGASEIWFGASGGIGGAADPFWGGANVWVSLDGTSFNQIGTINGVMPSGVLTAPYANSGGFDTTDTLSVDLTQSGADLNSTSDVNAQLGAINLCLLGSGANGELADFAVATLTGVSKYDLTRIQRALFGTTHSGWPSGTPFSVLQNMLKLPLAPQYVGQTLYFKFQSFSIYGSGVQDISTCTVYTYPATGNGAQVSNPSTTVTASGASVTVPITIPANSYILNVRVENQSVITGGGVTGYSVDPQYNSAGGAGPTSGTWGSNTAANAAVNQNNFSNTLWSSATQIVLTFLGGSPTAGSIKVSVSYINV